MGPETPLDDFGHGQQVGDVDADEEPLAMAEDPLQSDETADGAPGGQRHPRVQKMGGKA